MQQFSIQPETNMYVVEDEKWGACCNLYQFHDVPMQGVG